MSITKEQATTWLKNNISKTNLSTYIQGFVDCIDDISKLTKDSKPAELRATLTKLRNGCEAMTENYCRKLWKKGHEQGIDSVDEICALCPVFDKCIQNPTNHEEGNLYYHIISLWKLLDSYEKTSDKNFLQDNQAHIIKHIKGVKDNNTQAQWFQNIADKWDD